MKQLSINCLPYLIRNRQQKQLFIQLQNPALPINKAYCPCLNYYITAVFKRCINLYVTFRKSALKFQCYAWHSFDYCNSLLCNLEGAILSNYRTLLQNQVPTKTPRCEHVSALELVYTNNVYYNCVNLKCTTNLLTLAISSNGSHVISMLNLCTQIILSQSCLSRKKIILFLRGINFTINVS